MTLINHARCILETLAKRRKKDGTLTPISLTELLKERGRSPSDYAVVFGQAVSLIDAACLVRDLPLLGNAIRFERPSTEYDGSWAIWSPFRQYIEETPLQKQWSDEDFATIEGALHPGSASQCWEELAVYSDIWLQRALLVTLKVRDAREQGLLNMNRGKAALIMLPWLIIASFSIMMAIGYL